MIQGKAGGQVTGMSIKNRLRITNYELRITNSLRTSLPLREPDFPVCQLIRGLLRHCVPRNDKIEVLTKEIVSALRASQ